MKQWARKYVVIDLCMQYTNTHYSGFALGIRASITAYKPRKFVNNMISHKHSFPQIEPTINSSQLHAPT